MDQEVAKHIALIQENLPLLAEWGMRLLGAALVVVIGLAAGNWCSRRITAIRRLDKTLAFFLAGFCKYIIIILSFVTVLGQFGVQTASLLTVIGAAGLAIGLAMQGTLSNVAAGVMMLILRPFNVGDYITTGTIGGSVQSLGLFGTELHTPDNVYIYVPNSKLWGNDIWNYTRNPVRRQDINFSISYDDDIGKAIAVIKAVLDADARLLQEPQDRKPEVLTNNMGDFSIDLIARFWCTREDYWNVKWALTKAIKETLDQNGITIPFPTRTLHMPFPAGREDRAA